MSYAKAMELYKKATKTTDQDEYSQPLSSRLELLREANKIFNSELKISPNYNYDHRAILYNNIGKTSLRLAQLMSEAKTGNNANMIIYYVNEAVRNLTMSWLWRPQNREEEWGDKVTGSINAAFDAAFRSLGNESKENWPKQLYLLDSVLNEMEAEETSLDKFRLLFYTGRAHFYNCSAAKLMEKGNFMLTVRLLEYSRCDVELARKYILDSEEGEEPAAAMLQLKDAEDVMKFLKASCESVKLRTAADELFANALNDSEELMWDILDMYKAAAMEASNEDIKNEAIAIARQGILFHKVFKLESYAKTYCFKAVELANILLPEDYNKWFRECVDVIHEYQKEQMREEELKIANERAPYLEQLNEELKELKAVESCTLKLLKHVYAAHPPKSFPTYKYDEKAVNSDTIKKILTKAIFHYHPDRQASFERKWQILCEEITKRLTVKYECLKGVMSELEQKEEKELAQ